MNKTGMLDNTGDVVDAARKAGVAIMHAPITFAQGHNELSSHPLAPTDGDIVIEGKRRADELVGAHRPSWMTAIASKSTARGTGATLALGRTRKLRLC